VAPRSSALCPPHIQQHVPRKYRTSKRFAFSSRVTASYAIPVRRASALPSASFGFHLTVDTFAVRLTVPLAGPVADFHRQFIQSSPQ
jgi:hypothetical protein